MTKRATIYIDLDSADGFKKAEAEKARLENAGYTLINSEFGFSRGTMTYDPPAEQAVTS